VLILAIRPLFQLEIQDHNLISNVWALNYLVNIESPAVQYARCVYPDISKILSFSANHSNKPQNIARMGGLAASRPDISNCGAVLDALPVLTNW